MTGPWGVVMIEIMASRAGRSVFAVNAAVSVALVVLVAAVALVVNPPAPPGIAAFAPQASKPITKAPMAQSAQTGIGAGKCATGDPCSGPSATPRPTASTKGNAAVPAASPTAAVTEAAAGGVPSSLQCFAWPDGAITQTFDPQSPPCVASWPGQAKGNGGATSPGVTGTEIRVAVPMATSNASSLPRIDLLQNFFNSHFELYGRKITLVPYASKQADEVSLNTNPNDAAAQKADAEQVSGLNVFAATDFFDNGLGGALAPYIDTLASHKILAVVGGEVEPTVTDAHLKANAPYLWSYQPTTQSLVANMASMACTQLAGHAAAHAGGNLRQRTRRFAVMIPNQTSTGDPIQGINDLGTTLTGCSGATVSVITYDPTASSSSTTTAAIVKLKQQGVTSIVFYPAADYGANGGDDPQVAANQASYQPEWIVISNDAYDAGDLGGIPGSTTALKHTFGVGAFNKLFPYAQEIWFQAYVQAGGDSTVSNNIRGASALYHELLVLASGIQAAGPDLTPATFAHGLTSTVFPNPGSGVAPTYQGTVGFQDGPTMINDYLEFWLAPSTTTATIVQNDPTFDEENEFCWTAAGLRGRTGSWSTQDRNFQGSCR